MNTQGTPEPPPGGFVEQDVMWIFGHPRSGTTWAAALIRDAFDMQLWNEPNLAQPFVFANSLRANEPRRFEDPTFWMADARLDDWPHSVRLFLNDVIARQAGPKGHQTGLVIKEPNGSMIAPYIMRAQPRARVVFMIRDIRAVIASLIDANKPGSWMAKRVKNPVPRQQIVRQSINRMGRIVERIQETRGIADAGHHYEMRYETLRSDTKSALESFAAAVGLPIDEARVANAVETHSYENIPDSQKGAGKFVRNASIGGWQSELTSDEVDLIQTELGGFLEEFGYELVDPASMVSGPAS